MEELIRDYTKKVHVLTSMVDNASDILEEARLKIKLGCYRAFLTDLKRTHQDLISEGDWPSDKELLDSKDFRDTF